MRYASVIDCAGNTPLVTLTKLFNVDRLRVMAKLEMLNPSGSIKDRAARYMIEKGLQNGSIRRDSHLIESSSGNFAIAVAAVARYHDLRFTCVVDSRICPANLTILRLLGADIEMVTAHDEGGAFLKGRLARVRKLLDEIDGAVWLNQYASDAHWEAHYEGIATEMIKDIDEPPDYLVAAVSTTGTIMGISRRLKECFPTVKVVAVDLFGSVVFGGAEGNRVIPGIGSSVVPQILDPNLVDDVVLVSNQEAVDGARALLVTEAILAGGSSGAVVAAIRKLIPRLPRRTRVLTVFPDRGERYLDSVYAGLDEARSPVSIRSPLSVARTRVSASNQISLA